MEIQFIGAAQTVTGSMHLVRTRAGNILLDCGMFQGTRRESIDRNQHLRAPIRDIRGRLFWFSRSPFPPQIPSLLFLLSAPPLVGAASRHIPSRRRKNPL